MSGEPAVSALRLEHRRPCSDIEVLIVLGVAAFCTILLKEEGLSEGQNDNSTVFERLSRAFKKREKKARRKEAHRKFRAKPEVRRKRAEVARRWREHNHAKRLAQPWLQRRAEARNAHYHRPFVAIDSEGMNYPGNDVIHNGVVHPDHRTFLWGAAGVIRIAEPTTQNPHGEFCDLPLHWLGHGDKRPLNLVEILDWLTGLPEQYGPATFISYGFNYDVTMILQAVADYMPNLAYRKVYEICKKERLGSGGAIKVKGHVFVGDYAIDWIKGKRLIVKKFRDPNNPKAGFICRMTVYDVFGFYQSGFLKGHALQQPFLLRFIVPLQAARLDRRKLFVLGAVCVQAALEKDRRRSRRDPLRLPLAKPFANVETKGFLRDDTVRGELDDRVRVLERSLHHAPPRPGGGRRRIPGTRRSRRGCLAPADGLGRLARERV
jgi:hypothetical protein